ncbi:leucyl aminopeptidase [Lentilitoribacter sp. Alg239-R112]|uniref:leucyl aminopeptidase n=1 Tax=Lentilitoribacter sp. Alg239-R112 TaxID=2305987 RepID=UPI0013A6C8A7|nr:leucyl aminopeptidase [Lentilitoribacter sp. Alg239-R112]
MKIDLTFSKTSKTACDLAVFVVDKVDEYPADIENIADDKLISKAAKLADFSAKSGESFTFIAPDGSNYGKVLVVGIGNGELDEVNQWLNLGGQICAKIGSAEKVNVFTNSAGEGQSEDLIAHLAAGLTLRAYDFDQYKTVTKKKDADKVRKIKIVDVNHLKIKKSFVEQDAIVQGVILARNMVNEPANTLGPVEFAAEAKALEEFGIKTEILTEKQMSKLGMNALLGVSLGSERPPRLAIMRWDGGKKSEAPIAFVGKGVVFDTGGISIKPAGGMEDMKGDMGGAAAVIGLMKTLAMRKAKTNVVGILGLVENMPDGKAQRPGDIVTSMSGQTIEVINTDAEGRLVLCDALHYCNTRFNPQFMINLATLTGAVLVALGNHHAGLFSNNDELADQISEAGLNTRERVWRLPLDKEYDKMIDSKFADMKNTGGRHAGSITAAQFLQRFVGETPWAHLDVAGTAMGSPKTDINTSWGSGFGVRLLNQLVEQNYE